MGKEDKVVMDEELQLQEEYLRGRTSREQYELRLRRLSRERDKKLQMLGMLAD